MNETRTVVLMAKVVRETEKAFQADVLVPGGENREWFPKSVVAKATLSYAGGGCDEDVLVVPAWLAIQKGYRKVAGWDVDPDRLTYC